MDILQSPGDTVFVPSGWWHATLNLPTYGEDVTVACTRNILPAESLPKVFVQMQRSDPGFARSFRKVLRERRPELLRLIPDCEAPKRPRTVGSGPGGPRVLRAF